MTSEIFQPLNRSANVGMSLVGWPGKDGSYFTSGYITDFHFWKRSLSMDEMHAFTTCQGFEPGNLLPWNVKDWKIYNESAPHKYSVVTVDSGVLSDLGQVHLLP